MKTIAHYEKDIKDKNLNQLIQYDNTIDKNYELFLIVDRRWKNQQNKL